MRLLQLLFTYTIIPVSVAIFSGCSQDKKFGDKEIDGALFELEQVINMNEVLESSKEAKIDSLRALLSMTDNIPETYAVCDALFDEYQKWDSDSALSYAHKKEMLALESGSAELINDASIDMADRYIISGQYHEALNTVLSAEELLTPDIRQEPRRLYLIYKIYHGLVQSTTDSFIIAKYKPKEAEYLKLCNGCLGEDVIDYYNIKANTLLPKGEYDALIELMRKKLLERTATIQDKAVYTYWMAKAYDEKGDDRNALLGYVISAKYDLLGNLREYRSLIRVAQICFKYGRINRAYRLITRSYSDAIKTDAQIRLLQIGQTLPQIVLTYEYQTLKHRRFRIIIFSCLLTLLGVLCITIVFLKKSQRRLDIANREISRNLQALKESNRIKDTYLSQFLSMFSDYIDSLERYRSRLRITAKKMDFNAIQQELRSDEFIDAEWAALYDRFDKTFLSLFPDFTAKLNSLLKPGITIGKSLHEGRLNNELRVFALIRLGVTESERISKFLRLSLSTVFNYRVKLRNAAAGERETFEDRLSKIGF